MTRHLRPAVTPDWLERCTCTTTGHCVACQPQRDAHTLGPAPVSTDGPSSLPSPAPAGSAGAGPGPTFSPTPRPTKGNSLLESPSGWGTLFDIAEDCGA